MDPLETPGRALVFTPHADDAEGGCGGTLSKWIKAGTEVFLVLATDGRAGTSDAAVASEELVDTREREQADAARVMGVKEVVNLRIHDGGLEDDAILRGHLVEAIRRFKPDVVLTTEPYHRLNHAHRDHRTIGIVAQDACYPYARDIYHFPEQIEAGLEAHKVGAILFWGSEDPSVFCDITDNMETKIEALKQHKSQFLGRDPGEGSRNRAKQNGEQVGAEYAEIFRQVSFRR
mgnify:FL=1|jgi:LmbE family N-acetylglucosaminyl deacetylase